MIGYTLKHVLDLVPEALPLVKQASVEKDYPTDSRDSSLASALSVAYNVQLSKSAVDYEVMDKVASAVTAYGLEEEVDTLASKMIEAWNHRLVKQASSESEDTYLLKQAGWEGELTGFVDLEKIATEAVALWEKAAILGVKPSEEVSRYSGNLYLSKKAAIDALGARFYASKNDTFVKIAAALGKEQEIIPPGALVRNLCETVSGLDKKAHLGLKGFNFYKEALIEKEAAVKGMNACVCGVEYPMGKIMNLPPAYVNDYLGADFQKEISSDPASAKALVESLPMDTQRVLATLLKNAG